MILAGLGEVLAFAVAIWLNPIGIVALILILLADRPTAKAVAFALGWFTAVVTITAIAYALAEVADVDTDAAAADGVDVVRIGLGLLLWGLAYRQLRKAARAPKPAEPPALFDRVMTLSPAGAAAVGGLVAVVNLKALPFAIGAGASLAQSGLSTAEGIAALLLFGGLATLAVAGLVVASLAFGERVGRPLEVFKDVLVDNLTPIIVVLLVVMGALLIGKGLTVLG